MSTQYPYQILGKYGVGEFSIDVENSRYLSELKFHLGDATFLINITPENREDIAAILQGAAKAILDTPQKPDQQ